MPKSSDVGQLKPKCSIIGPLELIFNQHIEKHHNKPVCFQQQQKKSRKFEKIGC